MQLSDHQKAVKERFTRFAVEEIAPIRERLEQDLKLRRSLFQKMGQQGFFVLKLPKEFGGTGEDSISYVLA